MGLSLDYIFDEKKRFLKRQPTNFLWYWRLAHIIIWIFSCYIIFFNKDVVVENIFFIVLISFLAVYLISEKTKSHLSNPTTAVLVHAKTDRQPPVVSVLFSILFFVVCYFIVLGINDNALFRIKDYVLATGFGVSAVHLLYSCFRDTKPSREVRHISGILMFSDGSKVYYTPVLGIGELRLSFDMISMKSTTGLVDRLHGYDMTTQQMNDVAALVYKYNDNLIVKIDSQH